MMNKVLVTGSTGLVGQCVVTALQERGAHIVAHSRSGHVEHCDNFHAELTAQTDWSQGLHHTDVIVHCAAKVHQMAENTQESQEAYHSVNVAGTINLAKQAIQAGVKRLVFISSVKVNGEWSEESTPFTSHDVPHPQDDYGKSKYEAEEGLKELALDSELEVVIIRPPLVYGPGVRANFLSMINWLVKGVPLPFGKMNSKRSLIYADNLADLILVCCEHPNAKGKTFLVSDDEDISLCDLLRSLSGYLGKKPWLFSVPQNILMLLLTLIRKKALAQRLCKPLQVDIEETKSMLSWTPKCHLQDGLKKTINHYMLSSLNKD